MPTRRRAAEAAAQLPAVRVRPGTLAGDLSDGQVLAIPVAVGADGVEPRPGAADAAARYRIDLGDLAERTRAGGAAGDATAVVLPRGHVDPMPWAGLPERLVLLGIGDGGTTAQRRAGAGLARVTRGESVVLCPAPDGPVAQQAFVEGYLLGAYRHPTRARTPATPPAEALELIGGDSAAVQAAQVVARAAWLARSLAATPADTKNPVWLADRAADLARAGGLEVEVLDERALRAQGFGGLVAVAAGSVHPPRLVRISHRPRAGGRHVVVVGKGITYDTGGLSIKPREAMVPMKTDMTGAAVALATVLGAAEAGLPLQVTALLPLAENAVGAASYRPGDVLTVRGGTTVEVSNTDAEGRLVLADALVHADLTLDPDVLVDVATLTGAATMALGRTHGALFTADDTLADALLAAGERSGERLWRLPLVADYAPALDSEIADLHHVAGAGFEGAGAITAALFLQRFAGSRRWAHLDVAGPARGASASHEQPEGATGFGARVLLDWLTAGAPV